MDNNSLTIEPVVVETPQYILNEGQKLAVEKLTELCLLKQILDDSGKKYRMALIEGWAGTGKTFTINRLVESVKKINRFINFGLTAPTHKAVQQLKKHSELKNEVDFGTIHSFLGLIEKIDDTTGEVEYVMDYESKKERRIDGIDVLVIDECSMLSDKLFSHVYDFLLSRPNMCIIFMGDNLQIPPVGKKQSEGVANSIPFIPISRSSYGIFLLQLTEPVRQAKGNPIIDYSSAIREQIESQSIDYMPKDLLGSTGVCIETANPVVMRELFNTLFNSQDFKDNSDYCKVIAWRNATVNHINQEIRKLIFPEYEVLPMIVNDEKLVMSKPIIKNDKIYVTNNEEIVVKSVVVEDLAVNYRMIEKRSSFKSVQETSKDQQEQMKVVTVKVYNIVATTSVGKEINFIVLHESFLEWYEQLRKKMANAAKGLQSFDRSEMWRQFYKLERTFGWVTYNYCLTAHKAQGSTYEYTISMEWDISVNRDIVERNRIRYVAATRARKKLFIFRL